MGWRGGVGGFLKDVRVGGGGGGGGDKRKCRKHFANVHLKGRFKKKPMNLKRHGRV